MDVNIDPETRTALEANLTVRCLYKARFCLENRHDTEVFAWAEELVNVFSSALLAKIERADGATTQSNIVELFPTPHALICFDIFLKGCSEQRRSEIEQSLEQPIHVISNRGNVYWIRRNERMDGTVAAIYKRLQDSDKGPRPYFCDLLNPPLYDRGRRIDRVKDGDGQELEDNSSDVLNGQASEESGSEAVPGSRIGNFSRMGPKQGSVPALEGTVGAGASTPIQQATPPVALTHSQVGK
jgi:hypothetical protein